MEKTNLSLTIEEAETNVSVHSSHHLSARTEFGRFLLGVSSFRGLTLLLTLFTPFRFRVHLPLTKLKFCDRQTNYY